MSPVRATITERLEGAVRRPDIPDHALLKEDLGLDSIRLVALLTQLTQVLRVSILSFTDQDLVGLKAVGDLIELFERKTAHP